MRGGIVNPAELSCKAKETISVITLFIRQRLQMVTIKTNYGLLFDMHGARETWCIKPLPMNLKVGRRCCAALANPRCWRRSNAALPAQW